MESITNENLLDMKRQMAQRGNWKEVKRINKMLEFRGISTVIKKRTETVPMF